MQACSFYCFESFATSTWFLVQYDDEAFDMATFARYIEELQSYEIVLDYLKLAAYDVSTSTMGIL